LRAAVVAVFVAAVEALAEVVLILAQVHVVTVVTVACILIAERFYTVWDERNDSDEMEYQGEWVKGNGEEGSGRR
ncbi:MAG TPA: hypothetical protein VF899_22755, partial [Pyrinomonadaceae bacterium]